MAKKEVAEQAVEQVAEVADLVSEEAEQVAEEIRRLTGRDVSFTFVGAVIGAAVGGFLGYRFATKRLETKYEDFAHDEIDRMREHYRKKEKASEPKPDLQKEVERLGYASKSVPEVNSPAAAAVVVPEMPEGVTEAENAETEEDASNVFVENDRALSTDVWNMQMEMSSRTPEVPYVIHKNEWEQGNFQGDEHERVTLTYFQDDDILINEADQPISEIDEHVGLENLEKFGHGSEDANVVYVRNHRMGCDFQILRSMGSYAAEVHGIVEEDDALKHSAMRRHRSRRSDVDEE